MGETNQTMVIYSLQYVENTKENRADAYPNGER